MNRRLITIVALSRAAGIIDAMRESGAEIVFLDPGEPLRKTSEPLCYERFDLAAREPYLEQMPRDDGREREVGRLRREMMAREKSNRHMLKKGRGR